MVVVPVRVCALGLLFLAAAALGAQNKVTPVEKVIELLKKLEAQTTEEGKAEAKQYDKTACFCKEQADDKLYAIEKSKEKIKKLNAQIAALEAEIAELNAKITELSQKISDLEEAIKNLVAARTKEHTAYLKEAKNMDDAISAMERAIKALKDAKKEQTDSKTDLLQLRSSATKVLQTIRTSSSIHASDEQLAAVKVLETQPASEFQSNGIISMLENMLTQFKENKKELDGTEFDSKAKFEKEKLNMENEKKFAEKEKAEAEKLLGQKEDELADAKTELQEEEADLKADEAFLDELTQTCETQAKLFDQRSQARSGELTAIATAIEKLESGTKPNYDANEKLVELQQAPQAKASMEVKTERVIQAFSFLQKGSASQSARMPLNRALILIENAALRFRSPQLSTLAMRARSQEDHFVKVRSMIKDFIAKLEKQAEAEAESKAFCDKEMGAAISDRDSSVADIEKFTAKISNIETKLKKLAAEIKVLGEQIAELYKALNEATELREDEKADNMKTIADAQAGLGATKMALSALEKFYNNAFLQQSSMYTPPNAGRDGQTVGDMAPEQLGGEYHGNQDAAKGIIGLLEVIISDFERTVETTTSEEKAAQKAFEEFKKKSEEDIADKEKSKEEKEAKVADLTDELADTKTDLKEAKDKNKLALSELEELKGMCVEQPENWEEKQKKRTEEIEALKEAMVILDEWQK